MEFFQLPAPVTRARRPAPWMLALLAAILLGQRSPFSDLSLSLYSLLIGSRLPLPPMDASRAPSSCLCFCSEFPWPELSPSPDLTQSPSLALSILQLPLCLFSLLGRVCSATESDPLLCTQSRPVSCSPVRPLGSLGFNSQSRRRSRRLPSSRRTCHPLLKPHLTSSLQTRSRRRASP
jgi:hypothetical protein